MGVRTNGKDATRWTPRAREFVKMFRLYGAGITLTQFCKVHTFSNRSYVKWRKGIPGFKEEVDAIRKWHINQGARMFSAEAEEEALVEGGLTRKQSQFLAHYRETYDRVDALKLVRWDASDYQKHFAEHQEFRERVHVIDEEALMKAEDALRAGAINGSVAAARKYLEATKPEQYTKKIRHDHQVSARPTASGVRQSERLWGERFGYFGRPAGELVSGIGEAAGEEEVVDVEVVGQ